MTTINGLTNTAGVPVLLVIWKVILGHLPIPLREIFMICRTFNNLPSLRSRFLPISFGFLTKPQMSMRSKDVDNHITPWGCSLDFLGKYCSHVDVNCSSRLSGIAWPSTATVFRWKSRLPCWFFVRLDRLRNVVDETYFPTLRVPMITNNTNHYAVSPSDAEKKALTHCQLRNTMEYLKHIGHQDFDLTVLNPNLPNQVATYYVFVLGSPFNLYMDTKVEPDAKLKAVAGNICYLVYVLRSNTTYHIKVKNTLPKYANKSIAFRTNVFAKDT